MALKSVVGNKVVSNEKREKSPKSDLRRSRLFKLFGQARLINQRQAVGRVKANP